MAEFVDTREYPAGIDRLWSVFGNRAVVEAKYRVLGSTGVQVLRFDASPARIEVELERTVATDPAALPAWAAPLVGGSLVLRQHSVWTRSAPGRVEGTLAIRLPAGAAVAEGSGEVAERGRDRSVMRFTWRVRSRLPVLGPRIARVFSDQVRAALAADHAFTVDHLRRH